MECLIVYYRSSCYRSGITSLVKKTDTCCVDLYLVVLTHKKRFYCTYQLDHLEDHLEVHQEDHIEFLLERSSISSDATPGTSKHSAPLSESNHPAAPANRYFMWREISGVLFMWRQIYMRTMKNIRCAPASSVPARSSCWTACNSSVSCLQCKLHAKVNLLTSLTLQPCNQAGKDLSCSAR